ncbi:MAG: archease [Calditrichaceae bacterium]
MNDRYHIFDHTADAGIEITGKTIADIFLNAAAGMYHIMGIYDTYSGTVITRLKLIDPTLEDLLVSFLSELNFFITVRKKILCTAMNLSIEQIGTNLVLNAHAGTYDLSISDLSALREIKSVTYHQLLIVREQDEYLARVIFDI